MRGEVLSALSWELIVQGSSPHARGALLGVERLRSGPGIIPACAGSTTVYRDNPEKRRDHPRMRGEHRYCC